MKRRDFLQTGVGGLFVPMWFNGRKKASKPKYKWEKEIEIGLKILECAHDWSWDGQDDLGRFIYDQDVHISEVEYSRFCYIVTNQPPIWMLCRLPVHQPILYRGKSYSFIMQVHKAVPLIRYVYKGTVGCLDAWIVLGVDIDWERMCPRCTLEYKDTKYTGEFDIVVEGDFHGVVGEDKWFGKKANISFMKVFEGWNNV